jgi:hypothetical protein
MQRGRHLSCYMICVVIKGLLNKHKSCINYYSFSYWSASQHNSHLSTQFESKRNTACEPIPNSKNLPPSTFQHPVKILWKPIYIYIYIHIYIYSLILMFHSSKTVHMTWNLATYVIDWVVGERWRQMLSENFKPGFHLVVMVVKIESRSFATASL